MADALSRVDEAEIMMMMALSVLDSNLSHKILESCELDLNTSQLLQKLKAGDQVPNF